MIKRAKGVTISQVADAAGVARSSVSRAFTRPGMLLPETVERIMMAAEGLGYVPNHTARAGGPRRRVAASPHAGAHAIRDVRCVLETHLVLRSTTTAVA